MEFVPDGAAPSDEHHQNGGTWVEFVVDDVNAAVAAIEALKIERLSYSDLDHPYFQLPGGQIFRLAAATPPRT